MSATAVKTFFDLATQRRSVYTIDDQDPNFSITQIEWIVKQALETCPSPWNINSSCCLVLTGKHHKKLFNDIVLPALQSALPEDAFDQMKGKVDGLTAGIGTVLFFESQNVWDKLVEQSPRSEPMVEPWSNVVNGMAQYTVWTALAVAGFGCSLQHYDWSEEVVRSVQSDFGAPDFWRLKAQLVFGHKTEEPGEIPFKPLATMDERFKIMS